MTSSSINVEDVKRQASGQWAEILSALGGIPREILDGRHHPCPRCGGTDRFRLIDSVAGAVLCNQCFASGNGDGIAALEWLKGWEFKAALAEVAAYIERTQESGTKAASPPGLLIDKTYDYRDEQGRLLYQVCRLKPKDFRQRAPMPNGGWTWTTKGVRKVLYRLPELRDADRSRVVLVVEGEKDVDRLATLGVIATTNSGGAGNWRTEFGDQFRDRKVAVLPDNDDVGRRHAHAVAQSLQEIATWVKVVDLPGVPPKGDVSDWLDSGGTHEQLLHLVTESPLWTPNQLPKDAESQAWGNLEPLGEPDLPTFPLEAIPEPVRSWISAEAEATQTPLDLAGLLVLGVCGAATAKKIEVCAREGWLEPVNLFVVAVLEPGNRKSAVFHDATKPIRDFGASGQACWF